MAGLYPGIGNLFTTAQQLAASKQPNYNNMYGNPGAITNFLSNFNPLAVTNPDGSLRVDPNQIQGISGNMAQQLTNFSQSQANQFNNLGTGQQQTIPPQNVEAPDSLTSDLDNMFKDKLDKDLEGQANRHMSEMPTMQDEKDKKGVMETLGSYLPYGMLAGAGVGIVNDLFGGQSEKERAQQKWLDEMERRNRANDETIRATNAEANRRGAMLGLQDAQAGALAQAGNIGAGQALNSGLGGDVSSAQIAGVKAAAPVMAAAGQFGQAEAGLMAQKAQEEAQRNQQLVDNQRAGTEIESQRLWFNNGQDRNWLAAAASGVGLTKQMWDTMSKSDDTHKGKDKDKTQTSSYS